MLVSNKYFSPQEIDFELLSATNGGHILSDESHMTLLILANDNPHGTLEFTQPVYIIRELDNDTTQYVPITRMYVYEQSVDDVLK